VLNSFLAPLLEKDCAVCKDQFSLRTEDPDEQVVITLPCQHPFHSPCILPWLKQNGTCPSCRYQLVPQPGSATNPNENTVPGPSTATPNIPQPSATANPFIQPRTDTSSSRWGRDRGEPPESGEGGGGGFLGMVGNFWHSLNSGHQNSGPPPSSSGSGFGSLPGGWEPSSSSRPESGSRSSHMRSQSIQPNHATYPNPGSTRSPASSYDQRGSTFGSSHNTSSNNRDRNGDSTHERVSGAFGRNRRSSYDRERERNRDRNGQRRNTHPWENQDLD
jgi:hypothetical protein